MNFLGTCVNVGVRYLFHPLLLTINRIKIDFYIVHSKETDALFRKSRQYGSS